MFLLTNVYQDRCSQTISIEDIKGICDKDHITWHDFGGYVFKHVGSGILVRIFPIDEKFYLVVGSTDQESDILYVHLVSFDKPECPIILYGQ